MAVIACQKRNDLYSKNEIAVISKKLDTLSLTNIIQSEKYLDKSMQTLLKFENDSTLRNTLFKVAGNYYNLNRTKKYYQVSKKLHELAIAKKDTAHIARALYYIGDYYDDKTQIDSALYYYLHAEKLYTSLKDTLNSGKMSLYKAGIFYDAGSFDESEIETIKALRLLSKTKKTRLIYECYTLIALSLKELNDYKEALNYFKLALSELDKLENEDYSKAKIISSRVTCYNNIGYVYEALENYPEAKRIYTKGLITPGLRRYKPNVYAMLLGNLGYVNMKSGDTIGVYNTLVESLRIRDSISLSPGIVSGKLKLGEFFLLRKDTTKAIEYFSDSYRMSKINKNSYDIVYSLKLLAENDIKNKIYYSDLVLEVTDSVQKAERIRKNKFARIAYETDQIQENNELLIKRNSAIVISALVGFVIFTISFILYRVRARNKELVFEKEQQKFNEEIYQLLLKQQSEKEMAREEERNRIAMELHDGIVNSIFTTRFNLMQLDADETDKRDRLVAELESAEKEIRRVSHDLTKNLLFEDKNLPDIITNLVASQQNKFHTQFDLTIDKYIDWSTISDEIKINIYRIIQEAIQNINKYSEASKCYIMLLKTSDKLTIRIWDNGVGFDTADQKKGIGLKNIHERAKAVNGKLKIKSKKGEGTTIEIII